jgi:integrase
MPSAKTNCRATTPLTAAEARQFLDAARADRLHALYELALRTGLRKGELLGLHWEDLGLNAGTATIRHSLQRTRTGGLTQLPTKTRASERRIALPTECLHSLKEHQERQERTAASPSPRPPADLSTRPTSPAASAASSTGPGSGASASMTFVTRPRPCYWNRESTSS